jgi:hypothetical protein
MVKVTPPPSFPSTAVNGQTGDYDDGNDDGDIGHAAGTSTPPSVTPVTNLQFPVVPSGASSAANSTVDLPRTAGFDFKAISNVLGKNVDPESVVLPQPSNRIPEDVQALRNRAPLERTESAPSLSVEDAGDIGRLSPAPSTQRPSPLRTESSFSPTDETPYEPDQSTSLNNEWSAPASSSTPNLNAPSGKSFPSHVLESATNIFRNNLTLPNEFDDDHDDTGDIAGFGRETTPVQNEWSGASSRKVKDDWALNNPW